MALVSLQNVSISFGGPLVLDGATMQVERADRMCLVGSNGAGKSTLLKLVMGELEPDDGAVVTQNGVRIAMLEQNVPTDQSGSVLDVVASGAHASAGHTETRRAAASAVSKVNLNPEAPFASLSGGQKRRAMLARALVVEPDLLLLDEPTNHLDIDGILWLEEFLRRFAGAVLFVTHDRTFLKNVAKRIAELDRGRLRRWNCSYEVYLARKESQLAAEEQQSAVFDRKLAEEEAWVRKGLKARRTRNEGRVRALQAMREERRQRRERPGSVALQVQEAERPGTLVLEANGVSFGYDETPLLRDLNLVVQRGDRIGIMGANGSGKTTLLNLMVGDLSPTAGTLRRGVRLQVCYADQLRAGLDESRSVWENVTGEGDTVEVNDTRRHVIGYLEDFLFPPDRARSPVAGLSGGERNRLMLARLFARPSNVLVFDEPTNDLDIQTVELLEEVLGGYQGTLLIVSHDREFLNNVVTCTLAIEPDGTVRECAGGYDDWFASRQQSAPARVRAATPVPAKPTAASDRKKLGFNETRELAGLPARIEELEQEREHIFSELARPDAHERHAEIGSLKDRLAALEAELSDAYARWEFLEGLGE